MHPSDLCERDQTNRYRDTLPVIAELYVNARLWHRFRSMLDDCETAKLIKHCPQRGRMVAHVACLDDEVAALLAEGWET